MTFLFGEIEGLGSVQSSLVHFGRFGLSQFLKATTECGDDDFVQS